MFICWKPRERIKRIVIPEESFKSRLARWNKKYRHKWEDKWHAACEWHLWFVWFPVIVSIEDRQCFVWLRHIQRKLIRDLDEESGPYFYGKYPASRQYDYRK
jgi:hypothetical protein